MIIEYNFACNKASNFYTTEGSDINLTIQEYFIHNLSSPKQEKFIFENRAQLNVKFVAAVGGVLDFFAGNIRREKDSWFVNHGMEWLPRLVQEPQRLWRRMFVSAPIFLWHVIKQRVGLKFKGK